MRWRVVVLALAALSASAAASAQQTRSSQLITLHDDLGLSPDQEAAWSRYTTAITPSPEMQARHNSAAGLMPLIPTPRRVALIEANMDQDGAVFRQQGQAVIAFYNQLTPDQQRTFDRETLPQKGEPTDTGSPGAAPQDPSRR